MSETQRDGSEMRCKRCGANECRIHGFCSVECEHYFDYEEEITDLEARIAELEAVIEILEDQQGEAKNILIDKKLHIDSLYEEGYKLQQRIAELEEKQRWIPVSERLPEANKCVLVYDAGGNMTVDFLVTSGEVEKYFWLAKYRILFWMPLPEPPKECE